MAGPYTSLTVQRAPALLLQVHRALGSDSHAVMRDALWKCAHALESHVRFKLRRMR